MKNQKAKPLTANQQAKALQNTLTRLDVILKVFEIAKQGIIIFALLAIACIIISKGVQVQGIEWGDMKVEFKEPISTGGRQIKE